MYELQSDGCYIHEQFVEIVTSIIATLANEKYEYLTNKSFNLFKNEICKWEQLSKNTVHDSRPTVVFQLKDDTEEGI